MPHKAYLDSILADVGGAGEKAIGNPPYYILNLLRVLRYLRDGAVVSKEEGGVWGVGVVSDRYVPLIENALRAYRGENAAAFDPGLLGEFARAALYEIRRPLQSGGFAPKKV